MEAAGLLAAGAVGVGIWRKVAKSGVDIQLQTKETEGSDELPEEEPLQLAENLIHTFEVLFGGMQENQIIFVDQMGNIIEEPIDLKNLIFPEDVEKLTGKKENDRPAPPGQYTFPHGLSPDQRSRCLTYFFANQGHLNKEWVNKWRRFFKQKYPSLDLEILKDQKLGFPLYYTTRSMLMGSMELNGTYLDMIWPRTQATVGQSGKTKLDYAKEVFARSGLPEDFTDLVIAGIPGIESGFRDTANSGVAYGAWQFLKKTAKDYGLVKTEETTYISGKGKKIRKKKKRIERDYRGDFPKATLAASQYMKDLYEGARNNPTVSAIQQQFKLSDKDFLYFCVLSGYHAGPDNLQLALDWFWQQCQTNKAVVLKRLGRPPYGLNVYALMVDWYVSEHKNANQPYKYQSRDYPFRARALANLLTARRENPHYRAKITRPGPYQPPKRGK